MLVLDCYISRRVKGTNAFDATRDWRIEVEIGFLVLTIQPQHHQRYSGKPLWRHEVELAT